MKSRIGLGKILALFIFLAIVASAAAAQDKPANVAGSWTINVSGDTGNAKQSMTLAQDGGKITGTFKGPRQSGTIAGTIDGNNIKFHVTAGIPLDYTGTVDGDSMSGTMSAAAKPAIGKRLAQNNSAPRAQHSSGKRIAIESARYAQ